MPCCQVHSLIEKSLLKSWDAHQTRLVETAIIFLRLISAKQWAAVRVLAQWSRKLCNKIILILFKCARFYLCTLFLFGIHMCILFEHSRNDPFFCDINKMVLQDPSSSPFVPLHPCHCQQLWPQHQSLGAWYWQVDLHILTIVMVDLWVTAAFSMWGCGAESVTDDILTR